MLLNPPALIFTAALWAAVAGRTTELSSSSPRGAPELCLEVAGRACSNEFSSTRRSADTSQGDNESRVPDDLSLNSVVRLATVQSNLNPILQALREEGNLS